MHILIGMCCYNNLQLTKKAVDSILKNTNFNTYSLFFVDDASTDGTAEYLKELSNTLPGGCQIVTNKENIGYTLSANKVFLNRGKADAVVLCNTDVEVTEGWLHKLVSNLSNIVGCKILRPDGSVQHESVKIIEGKTVHGNFKDCDYVNGSCFLVRSSLLDKIGIFDEAFAPAYHEETDLCLRAKLKGYKVGYEESCCAYHKTSSSYSQKSNTQEIYEKSWELLQKRYGIEKYYKVEANSIAKRFDWIKKDYTYTRDIIEHLDTLKGYASRCPIIVELGTREGISTTAFALAKPKKLYCYDVIGTPFLEELRTMCKKENIGMYFLIANDLEIEIPVCDLLFIDTWHTYKQLSQELKLHGNSSSKYIIFHDTETFGAVGEDGTTPGLNQAISEFLIENPHWKLKERYTNNNGLTILERTL